MVDITETTIASTLPSSIASDKTVRNLSESIQEKLNEINTEKGYVLLLPRLDELSEALIDELAWQYHVDFYDNNADIVVKRNLVRNTIKWHMKKGTPYAVKAVCSAAFKTCDVKEWFEYGASPYHFKIDGVEDNMPDELSVGLIVDAINKTKNVRSWCDGLEFKRNVDCDLYIALTVNLDKEITIKQVVSIIESGSINEYLGAVMLVCRKVEIK